MAIKGKSVPGALAPGKLLRKYFGDIEIAEAKRTLTLFPNWNDFKEAKKHDPQLCGFARCAARTVGAASALFFKRMVYIDHYGPDGVRRAYRYKADTSIYKVLAAFDKGRVKEEDVLKEFILRPPPKSDTLTDKRRASARWKKSDFGKAAIAFEKIRQRVSRLTERVDKVRLMWINAKDRAPQSAHTKSLSLELAAAKRELTRARGDFDIKRERMVNVGGKNYATGTPKPRKYDVDVRTGSRYFSLIQ